MFRAVGVVSLAVLAAAPAAAAKSFDLRTASVRVVVADDSSLTVVEHLRFRFHGVFHGADREISIARGQQLTGVFVREGRASYVRAGSAEIGSLGSPGTFAVADTPDGVRIVWHFAAANQTRTFTIGYTLSGIAKAYDDVVDLDLKVWGDDWDVPLKRLVASVMLPGAASGEKYRVYGHPAWVHGATTRRRREATLTARDVPPHQFVELRVVFPRSLVADTSGAVVRRGRGLPAIVEAERHDALSYAHDQRQIHRALRDLPWLMPLLAVLAVGPAALILFLTYLLFGRERRTAYAVRYETEPPTETPPALVSPLLRQRPTVGSTEFTATLFDLIRRGRYAATPTTAEVAHFGGLQHERISDLEISKRRHKRVEVAGFEEPVIEIVDAVLDEAPQPLSQFRHRIKVDPAANRALFNEFKGGVAAEIKSRGWFLDGGRYLIAPATIVFFAVGAILSTVGYERYRSYAPRWFDIVLTAIGLCTLISGAILGAAWLGKPALWRRRSRAAEAEAERWDAFRRYLTDFPRLADQQPATLETWERYLVYAIAFGIADRVLRLARLNLPEEALQSGVLGGTGNGWSGHSVGSFSSDLGSAFGSGGGFSGSGGGGSGGGGGSAW